jgi:hypothetical protein
MPVDEHEVISYRNHVRRGLNAVRRDLLEEGRDSRFICARWRLECGGLDKPKIDEARVPLVIGDLD